WVAGVVSDLLDPLRRRRLVAENAELQERLRAQHAERSRKPLLPLARARDNRLRLEPAALPQPAFAGVRLVEPQLAVLRPYIAWQFFFHAWELKGKFPAILEQPAALELYEDATALLDTIVTERLLRARGVYGFWPAASAGDDVLVEPPGGSVRLCFLRQQ